ncbi:hypothetical protein BLNAU_20786 [Blattamonas nauphoetae]|uniref:Protein kinase domain-containing protein n=1 Tax=Blattamonas nauphoetae TaxID=2049346 RepID=A0ABQ9X1W3_9EUKA|nr:hypothetical protein BLNAU_20786 [Blattamonas nauphoetae]
MIPFGLLFIICSLNCDWDDCGDTRLQPLSPILTSFSNSAQHGNADPGSLMLPKGHFFVSNHVVESSDLMMTGNETKIRFWDDRSEKKATRKLDGNVVGIETMFVFMNSSVCLSSLELDCGVEGVGTARVLGSNVVVSLCSIRSNMECSPFVVCWMGETDWNSITMTSSSHVSSCSPSLLPLVGICDDSIDSDKTASHEQLDRNDRTDRTDGWTPSVSITGSSIEFGDGDLILGTGPLIGSLDGIGNEEKMKSVSTSLVGCVLVNMTSRCSSELNSVGSWFGQSIVGSEVSLCSNHLYGTSIRSLNGGGSLLSLNSSFVSCLVDPTNENKPFTSQTSLTTDHPHVTFTQCTFKKCSAVCGGAIHSNMKNVDINIESCSFDTCTASDDAGAVYIQFKSDSTNRLILKSSFFTTCSSTSYDGSLTVTNPGASTISECLFVNSKTEYYGGALSLFNWDPATTGGAISNCLFQNCNTAAFLYGGGAIYISNPQSVQFSSLVFKDCQAVSTKGHLIYLSNTYIALDSSSVFNCTSDVTPTSSLLWSSSASSDRTDLLSKKPTPISLTALSVEIDETTADVNVTLDKEVSGTLLVVVSNVKGDRVEVPDGIPNIGRVLEFSIPSSSSIGSCSVSVGETGLLQTPLSDYFIVAAFHPGHIVSHKKCLITLIPKKLPLLISASCSLDASHTAATVSFEGTGFEDGEYKVSFQDGSSLDVEFTTDSDGKSTGTTDLGVIGSDPKWFEKGTWIVIKVQSMSNPTQSIEIDHPVSFTIPTVARLTGIEVSELDGSTKGKVRLSFSSVELEKGVEYTLTLNGQDSDQEELTRKMTTSVSGDLGVKEEVLYPFETDVGKRKQQMKFGVLYKVTSLKATGRSNSVQVGSVVIQMPVEPVRLTQIEKTVETETSLKLLLTGSGFVSKETYTVEVSGVATEDRSSNAHTRTFTVVASATTSASSSTLVLSISDPTSLQFGQTYTVTKIDNGTNPGIVVGTLSFSTPALPAPTPLFTSAVCSLDASHTKVIVDFRGTDFEAGQYKVTFQDDSFLDVEFTTDSDGKSTGTMDLGVIGSNAGWIEGTTWIVSKVKSVSNPTLSIDIVHPVSFTIPTVARLTGIEVSELDGSTKGKVRLSFSSVELEKGVEYTLTLNGQDSDQEELTRKMTTSVSGDLGVKEEVLYPFETDVGKRKQQMKFGVLYKVTSLKATGRSNSVQVGSVVIQMPVEPVRLTQIEKTVETETSLKLLLTGSGFVSKETYTVEVSGVATEDRSSNAHTRTFTVVASATTSASSSTLVLSISDPTSLQFGQTYTVTKIDNGTNPGIVVGTLSFSTPALPAPTPLFTSAVCSLDASHTKVIVDFRGTDFEAGQYKVTFQDDSFLDVEFTTDSDGKSTGTMDLGVIGSNAGWIEGTTWIVSKVKSVSNPTLSIDIVHPVSFTIPTVARLTGIEVSELDGSTKGKVRLSFSSVELEKGVEYTLTLNGQDSDQEELTRKMTTSVSGDLGVKEEVLYPFETDVGKRKQQMKFGVLYKVTSLKATGRSNSVQVGSVVIQMPVEPVRLTQIEKTVETETSLKLLLTGSGFVSKETYTVEVSGVLTGSESSNVHTRTFTVVASDVTSASSSTLVLSSSDPTSLKFGQTYSVKKIDNGTESGIVIETPSFSTSDLSVNPPSTARLTFASVEMNSQGILLSIVLNGEHLPSDSIFHLTLNKTITIPVSFSSSTKGKSEVVMLGLDGGLDFGKTYSITDLSNGGLKIIADDIQITTPPKPSELTLCVCSDDSGDSWMIRSGADVATCLRIERAWNLAERLSIHNNMMRIVKPASLSSPMLVSSLPFKLTSGNMDQSLLSLSQPSSMTNSDGSLLSITNGECGLTLLTITTSSSSSFVFISAQSSTITIQLCSIEGTSNPESNSEGSICGWKTGFLQFIESKANLSAVTLKGLGSGGIVQKGGEMTISTGIFSDNGQTNLSFPLARQNIHCEGEGKLMINSLAQGDGSKNTPSAWIDADECSISGDQDIVSSPLFVPTLDSDASSTNLDKKTNTMHFTVKGEILVPCGLDVEVFEWDSSKSVEGGSALLSLHSLATTKWTSTEIVGQVDLKTSLSSLNSSLEWRARLVFGDNRTTSNSFLFASASSTGKGNMSQGGVTSKMLWIIPVVVCALLALILLIVLIIFVTRRNKKKQNQQSLLMNEERSAMEMGEVILKEEDDDPDSTLNRILNKEGSILHVSKPVSSLTDNENRTFSNDTFNPLETVVRDIPESMQREAIQCVHPFDTKVVSCEDSLYCRLHGRENERKGISWKRVASSVANGLVQLHLRNPTHHALSALNPHRIVFDNETISIVLNHPTPTDQLSNNRNRQPHSLHPSLQQKSGQNEGERWEAPEVKRDEQQPKNECDQAKASVFSLGLVMFEMVTMTVPFGEVDGVNAHRQIVSGSLPDVSKIEDDSARDLISSCLAHNPKERPTLSSLSDSLNKLAQTDPSTAALPSHNVVQ